jgi:hypothetical protein
MVGTSLRSFAHPTNPSPRRSSAPLILILHTSAKESSQTASRLEANTRRPLILVHLRGMHCVPFATPRPGVAKIAPEPKKVVAMGVQRTYVRSCPISHVPVVVCQSVGIRTRGRTAAKGRRSRGSLENLLWRYCGRPASLSRDALMKATLLFATVTGSRRRTGAPRSQRGTRLKATTDRAFLVSTGSPTPARATEKACPSLPGVRAGNLPTNPRQHSLI